MDKEKEKKDFLLELSKMTHKELNDFIKSKGKVKLVEALIEVDSFD